MPSRATGRIRPTFVKKVREDFGLTFEGIGDMAGTSRQYVEKVFSGRTSPSVRFMSGLIRGGLADGYDEIAVPVIESDADTDEMAA
ncbi:helix-turn-helix domain-containing protein [Actinomyces faecalis]|uniref:helix-turn-helix domain-containing protein n=1 Tax=Actinomyces faecalis TaxID=2722820 RepID=UPI0015544968|nr:helix-turn-helix transcriptional regulator [Actinomyces faecalis]